MYAGSMEVVRKCKKCQQFASVSRIPLEELTPISSPWLFAQWGVDIVGPLPTGKGGVKFVVVAVDYFTKWTEAEALASITTQNVVQFLWKSIVTRFGIPHTFVIDNGRQFDCQPFREWCEKLGIQNFYSSPSHPQVHGQVEVTNITLFTIIKKKLEERKGA
jgi:IS30 family transposase